MQFTKAEKKKLKARIAFCGPSGSGKTHSALLVAGGLAPNGKIILIDSENRSALMESGKKGIPEFLHGILSPPFSPKNYIDGLHSAANAGADVIIIDSLSHAWTGEGGVLEMHDRASKGQSNTFAAWRNVTPEHNRLVDALIYCPCHIIITMRTKTHYDMVNENGKVKPVKVGLKPVQKEGLEYEFQIVFDLSVEGHIATASKDRTSLFDGQFVLPCFDTGKLLANYLDEGGEPAPGPVQTETKPDDRPLSDELNQPVMMTQKQSQLIGKLINSHVFTEEEKSKTELFLSTSQDRETGKKMIDRLLSLIETRKAEEKKAETDVPYGGVRKDERSEEEIRQAHENSLADLIAGLDSCKRAVDVSDYIEQVTGALLLLPEDLQEEFDRAQGEIAKNL